MCDILFLYVTAPDDQTARRIAKSLIEEKLAACVNILAPMRSIYRWKGAIEETDEIPMIVKTTKTAAQKTRDRITSLHPYETPCIVALSVSEESSSAPFLDWIRQATNA